MGYASVMRTSIAVLSLAALVAAQQRTDPARQPVEQGAVSWYRDFDAAQKEAQRSGRPLLVLFQEVPGCSTCRSYGTDVLSDPIVVEAAETLFVPACVHNNTKDDADAEAREAFEEPAWNNPVVRIVDADRHDLVPRIAERWSVEALATAMVTALGERTPRWLRLYADEQRLRAGQVDVATFAMG